jgi:hypothetical protein
MNKSEREKLRDELNELIEASENHPRVPYEISAYRLKGILDHIDALESSNLDLEQKVELVTINGKNYQAADVRAMIKRIDALEGKS